MNIFTTNPSQSPQETTIYVHSMGIKVFFPEGLSGKFVMPTVFRTLYILHIYIESRIKPPIKWCWLKYDVYPQGPEMTIRTRQWNFSTFPNLNGSSLPSWKKPNYNGFSYWFPSPLHFHSDHPTGWAESISGNEVCGLWLCALSLQRWSIILLRGFADRHNHTYSESSRR